MEKERNQSSVTPSGGAVASPPFPPLRRVVNRILEETMNLAIQMVRRDLRFIETCQEARGQVMVVYLLVINQEIAKRPGDRTPISLVDVVSLGNPGDSVSSQYLASLIVQFVDMHAQVVAVCVPPTSSHGGFMLVPIRNDSIHIVGDAGGPSSSGAPSDPFPDSNKFYYYRELRRAQREWISRWRDPTFFF